MALFGGILSIKSVTFLMFSVFVIAALGYILGRFTIKGVNMGTAGVFIIALLFGCFFYPELSSEMSQNDISYVTNALKIVENMGLILFVTSVGFIAGPGFFGNCKKNFKSYVALGLIIVLAGGLACVACILIGRNFTDLTTSEFTAMMIGLFAGSLTSTPAFSAAKGTVAAELESIVSVGYGISYLFGVIGVVLFVQLIPKILKVNMEDERGKLIAAGGSDSKKPVKNLIEMDDFGLMPFALAVVLGLIFGCFKFGNFSLTTTGGCLLVSLVFGHFGHIGKFNIMPDGKTLKVFREFGLMLFLIGAGVSGGAKFVQYFNPIYFLYGAIMTIVPMIIGFLFVKYVLKISILNNLGSITGGMTSTPALGTLIHVAKTEAVASSYAATYPVALISVVLVAQFVIILFS